MEFRIADFRLLIAELRKSAVNNRESSFKDDRNRNWLFTKNVEELKNAPQLQTHAKETLFLNLCDGGFRPLRGPEAREDSRPTLGSIRLTRESHGRLAREHQSAGSLFLGSDR